MALGVVGFCLRKLVSRACLFLCTPINIIGCRQQGQHRVSDKTFEGAGETFSVKKNKIVNSETLRIVEMSGEIFYLAKVPSNDSPVAFKLTDCTENTAVFENSQHDFPKKISYQYEQNKGITVFVSGENGEGFLIEYTAVKDSAHL